MSHFPQPVVLSAKTKPFVPGKQPTPQEFKKFMDRNGYNSVSEAFRENVCM